MSLAELEDWLYDTGAIAGVLGHELYLRIISYDFRRRDAEGVIRDWVSDHYERVRGEAELNRRRARHLMGQIASVDSPIEGSELRNRVHAMCESLAGYYERYYQGEFGQLPATDYFWYWSSAPVLDNAPEEAHRLLVDFVDDPPTEPACRSCGSLGWTEDPIEIRYCPCPIGQWRAIHENAGGVITRSREVPVFALDCGDACVVRVGDGPRADEAHVFDHEAEALDWLAVLTDRELERSR